MYGPDGSAGVTFVLVQATLTDNYHQGQLYSAGKGKADGGGCASTTTGRVGETITLSVLGGTGKFANASGSIKLTFIGQVLAGGFGQRRDRQVRVDRSGRPSSYPPASSLHVPITRSRLVGNVR